MSLVPLVSIGIPTHNRAQRLEKCLSRIIHQTYQNIEIIISDNCSPDPAVQQIGERFQRADSRISYIRQAENIMIEPNFNYVLSKANGKYFIWAADDDYYENDYIEKCVQFLEENEAYVHACGIPKYYIGDKYIFEEKPVSFENDGGIRRLLKYLQDVNKNGVFYGVFRKEIREKVKLKAIVAGDVCFMAQMAQSGKVKMMDTTSYHKSAEGGAANRAGIISLYGDNAFKRTFLATFMSYTVANNSLLADTMLIKKIILKPLLFIIFYLKLVKNAIRKRLQKR